MNDRTPTLTIESENGPVVINASDFDATKHKVYAGELTEEQAKGQGQNTDTTGTDSDDNKQKFVLFENTDKEHEHKWLIKNEKGEIMSGYKTKAQALEALKAK